MMTMQERGNGRREDGDRRTMGKQAPPSDFAHPQKCPRCDSFNTKFCYYNNYSLSQPRYYCKACRRYWTHGGSLRNVPIGGASRKGKRPKTTSSLSPLMTMLSPSPPPPSPVVRQSYISAFGGGGGGYASAPSNVQLINGFDYVADPNYESYGQQPQNQHLYQQQQQNQFLQQQPAPVFYPSSSSSHQDRMNMFQPMGNRASQQGGGNRFVMNNYNYNEVAGSSSENVIWNYNNGTAGAASNTQCGDQWRHDHDHLSGYGGAPPQ